MDGPSQARVFVVHGYQAAPDRHWFPWLASELAGDGFAVTVVPLPDSAAPRPDRWLHTLRSAVGEVDSRTWFVGHSLGCVTVLRYLASLETSWRAAGMVLVAGFDEPLAAVPELDEQLAVPLAPPAIARITARVPVRRVVRSDDDAVVPAAASDRLAAALSATVTVVPGAGHLTGSDGVDTLPVVRDLVRSGGGRPWPAEADRLARASVAAGDPTGWFDRLWSQARDGDTTMPWDSRSPHPLVAAWTRDLAPDDRPRSAVVVGCGLGADAEHVAATGVPTVAFDISATAVDLVRERYPDSRVDYRQADLFAVPDGWRRRFDLVVDVYTVQALPREVRVAATAAVAGLVAPGGRLLLVMVALPADADPRSGPPWPLTGSEIDAFTGHGLEALSVELLQAPELPGRTFWRAAFRRPAD